MCKPILQTSAFFWTIYYSGGVSKYAFPDLKSTNALYMYIYNLTVNLSIFCNNFVRFLEDAGRNSLVPFCSIACCMNSIFSDIVVMSALVASKSI